MNQDEFLSKAAMADISDECWLEDLLNDLTDRYAAGYLRAQVAFMNGNLSSTDEEFRQTILRVATWNIWEDEA